MARYDRDRCFSCFPSLHLPFAVRNAGTGGPKTKQEAKEESLAEPFVCGSTARCEELAEDEKGIAGQRTFHGQPPRRSGGLVSREEGGALWRWL